MEPEHLHGAISGRLRKFFEQQGRLRIFIQCCFQQRTLLFLINL